MRCFSFYNIRGTDCSVILSAMLCHADAAIGRVLRPIILNGMQPSSIVAQPFWRFWFAAGCPSPRPLIWDEGELHIRPQVRDRNQQ